MYSVCCLCLSSVRLYAYVILQEWQELYSSGAGTSAVRSRPRARCVIPALNYCYIMVKARKGCSKGRRVQSLVPPPSPLGDPHP